MHRATRDPHWGVHRPDVPPEREDSDAAAPGRRFRRSDPGMDSDERRDHRPDQRRS
jgi:hypothetical protein